MPEVSNATISCGWELFFVLHRAWLGGAGATYLFGALSTIIAVTAVLGLRIGETLALRTSDVDFAKHVIRVRQIRS